MSQPIRVPNGARVRLNDFDPGDATRCRDKDEALEVLQQQVRRMAELQQVLFAQAGHALLIVLQGMDGAGKDGTIRHVMSGLNPQGCRVTAFKVPTAEERAHDFLWRVHRETPPLGWIGIFNRSQYEDVLAARVLELAPRSVWRERYDHINHFEKLLADGGVTVLKFFLHISKDEQKERLEKRLEDPRRAWKFDPVDWQNRKRWKEYMAARRQKVETPPRCACDASRALGLDLVVGRNAPGPRPLQPLRLEQEQRREPAGLLAGEPDHPVVLRVGPPDVHLDAGPEWIAYDEDLSRHFVHDFHLHPS